MTKDQLNDFVPSTIREAVDAIVSVLGDDDRSFILQQDPAAAHFGGGRTMRNNWSLWEHDTPMKKDAVQTYKIAHGDDLSGLIHEWVWSIVRGVEFDPLKHCERYYSHWQRTAQMSALEAGGYWDDGTVMTDEERKKFCATRWRKTDPLPPQPEAGKPSLNPHGEWMTRHTPAWRARLESVIGRILPQWDSRLDALYGPPDPGIPQCTYCGSIMPEDFVRLIQDPATIRTEVADWKYGWPHKIYLTIPSINPEERRKTGISADGSPMWGTYATITLKFYTEHLIGYPELERDAPVIKQVTGILFSVREGKLHYDARP